MALTTSSLKDLSIDELKVLVSDSISSRYMPPDQLRKILLGTVRAIRPSQRRLTVEDGKKIMLPRASNDQLKVYIEYLFSDAAPDDEGVALRGNLYSLDLHQRLEAESNGNGRDAQWPSAPVTGSTYSVRGLLQQCVDFHFPSCSRTDMMHSMELIVPPTLPSTADKLSDFVPRKGVYALKHLPGFFFAPGALSIVQQEYWCKRALHDFLERPNRRNLDVDAGMKASRVPSTSAAAAGSGEEPTTCYPTDLWGMYRKWHATHCADDGKVSFETPRTGAVVDDVSWATLGWQYDWGTRKYLMPTQVSSSEADSADDKGGQDGHFVPMPEDIKRFGAQAAAAVGETLEAQAGIVNYYKLTASMGGHQDIAEQTYAHPVIGMSIGCGGVFLMGGETKDTPPLPILLRSGDVLFMGGVTRLCYHGVACMLPATAPDELFAPSTDAKGQEDGDRAAMRHWIQHHRLNMNVRQVLPDACKQ